MPSETWLHGGIRSRNQRPKRFYGTRHLTSPRHSFEQSTPKTFLCHPTHDFTKAFVRANQRPKLPFALVLKRTYTREKKGIGANPPVPRFFEELHRSDTLGRKSDTPAEKWRVLTKKKKMVLNPRSFVFSFFHSKFVFKKKYILQHIFSVLCDMPALFCRPLRGGGGGGDCSVRQVLHFFSRISFSFFCCFAYLSLTFLGVGVYVGSSTQVREKHLKREKKKRAHKPAVLLAASCLPRSLSSSTGHSCKNGRFTINKPTSARF